jgi:8-oxo-dGTP diphosphatase
MIHCVGAILARDGMLLLGRRAPTKRVCPELWDVIGGHVEAGETFEEALARELHEEIGVTPVGSVKLQSFGFLDGASPAELHVYRVDAWTGGEPALANDEHAELRWFSVEAACALPDLAADEYRDLFRMLEG